MMMVCSATGNLVYILALTTLLARNGCSASVLTHRGIRSTGDLTDLCSELRNGFVCGNCKTLVNCIEGEANLETCRVGDACLETSVFGGAVCQPAQTQSEDCVCSSGNKFYADAYDPRVFFFCRDVRSEPEMHRCSVDKEFDAQEQQCVSRDGLPECSVPGIFLDYRNCSQYYLCIGTQDGWVQKSYSCEKGTMYNEVTGLCEDPCSWPSGKFICDAEGRFPDPLSCESYYECVELPSGTLRQYHRKCPRGYAWKHDAQSDQGQCGKQADANCHPVKLSRCVLTELKCPTDLEAQISALETKKAEKDQQIQEVAEVVETLKTTGKLVAEIHLMTKQLPRTGELSESPNPDNNINVDAEFVVTVTPYCSSIGGEDVLRGSLTDVITAILDDVRTAVTDDLDLLPCLRDVLGILVNSVSSGAISLGTSVFILEEPAVKTIEAIKMRFDEMETVLGELMKERDELEHKLMRLKTLLESRVENTT